LTQVVADPDSAAFKLAETLRSEWVVRIDGKVRRRPDGTENPDLPTGAVEVYIREIEVLGPAGELPMPVFGDQEYPEETRLKYRFLDLRREHLHNNIMKRGQIIDSIRTRMKAQGFFEFQTPILTASSPEGARDYLVPSRIHPGKFYALPQAPQQFKQLIMVSGFDRYFQIAPCFRDEDARADRSPGEFYQLDLEMSFVTQEDVFAAVEPVMRGVFEEFSGGKPVTQKFPLIPYAEALAKYGTDKPDLRNPIVMQDVSEIFRGSGFKVFARILEGSPKAAVWAIPAPGGGSRAFCDRMNSWAQGEGQPGLGYIFFALDNDAIVGRGPVANNLGAEKTQTLRAQLGLKDGDAVFFVAGEPSTFVKFAGPARTKVGEELGLVAKDRFELCWIVDFPMYEWNEEEKKIDFSHNPFSMPNLPVDEFLALNAADQDKILGIKAFQYDIVCNGVELSSGAIRNHRPDVMKKAFAIAGYEESVLEQKFGGMLHALSLGAPPHGGIAPGIDRIVMLLCGEENLREVVLFPMNQRAEDLMMGAPAEATPKQLRELHIRVVTPG
jgi:aspartyl-tRNA synthetase